MINVKKLINKKIKENRGKDLWAGSNHQNWKKLKTPQAKGSIGTEIYKGYLESKGYKARIVSDEGDIEWSKDNGETWIKDEVKKYVDTLRMKVNLKYEGNAFFNIYKKHDYQETHDHAGSIISCIYFLKSNEKSSRVFFKSRMYDNIEHDSSNPPTGNVWFESQPGKLLIFRSYVQHFVEQHLDEEERISLAYNFKS